MLQNLPTRQNRMFRRLRRTMGGIADELVSRDRSMREEGGGVRKEEEKSIIGLLCEFFLKWCEWEADKGDSESGG